jgi:hypothetical protein
MPLAAVHKGNVIAESVVAGGNMDTGSGPAALEKVEKCQFTGSSDPCPLCQVDLAVNVAYCRKYNVVR